MKPTLYRMYGSPDCLLYVGRTINPISRLREHRLGKDWWDDIAAITLERFDTVKELAAAEAEAIATEHPIHNIVGNSLRMKIAAVGRQIDNIWGTPAGTSLKTLYHLFWPPELCTPEQFESVYALALSDLKILEDLRNRLGRTPTTAEVVDVHLSEARNYQ